MERTLDPKRDIRNYIDEMNRTPKGLMNTQNYKRGLMTLEEYITEMFRIDKEYIASGYYDDEEEDYEGSSQEWDATH